MSKFTEAEIDFLHNCLTCDHFCDAIDDETGLCLRYPPVYVGKNHLGEDQWDNPVVENTDKCGEYVYTLNNPINMRR